MGIKLSDLMVKDSEKTSKITYDKDWKVSFDMAFLSKSDLQSLVGKHTKIDFNPKNHQKEEVIDNEKLTADILSKCVKGWHGVNYKWLATQMVLDLTKVPNPEAELEFSAENLQTLVKNSYGLDSWFLDTVRNASNFNEKAVEETKN